MAYCSKCGTNNPDAATFCAGCGSPIDPTPFVDDSTTTPNYDTGYQSQPYSPVPTYPPVSYPASTPATSLPVGANVMSIISMVCGILSCCTVYVGIAFSIPAIILAAISKSKTPSGLSNGKSTAGLITGIIGFVLSIVWIIVFVAIIEEATSYNSYDYYDYYY